MARSTIILGVIAAALLAFILLHERDLLSSKELDQRKNRVLTSFVRDRVSRVEIVRNGQTIALSRTPDPENDNEFGPWRETSPMQVETDREAVDVLLGELEWLQPRRVIEGLSAEDQQHFGFDKPRLQLRFDVGKQRSVLLVGAEEPTGLGLYVRGDDPDIAYIVGKDLFEALDHDGGHFHTKDLHEGVFVFAASAVTSKTPSEELRAELRAGIWWSDTPDKTILSSTEVEAVVKALDLLRAKRFVATKVEGPLSYGLDAPAFVLRVERGNAGKADKALSLPVTLRVGAACGSHAAEKYIQLNDGPIMCAADDDLSKLMRSRSELVDKSALPLDPERLVEITLQGASQTIVLTKKEERWSYTHTVGGKASKPVEADRDSVNDWLKGLRGLQQTSREPTAPAGHPLATISFNASNTREPLAVTVITGNDGMLYAQRAGESTWLRFEPSASSLLTPVASRFRSLQLIRSDAALTDIKIVRAGTTEHAERVGTRWVLRQPVQGEADPVAVADMEHLLASLSVVRFVADSPTSAHGFGGSAIRVIFKLGDETRTLTLGATTDDGVFGQLDGSTAVFVVPTRLLETVSSGLLARTALATPAGSIGTLKVTAAGKTFAAEKQGARLVEIGTERSASAAVDRVARIRAESIVHYGAALANEGFSKPRLTIALTSAPEAGEAWAHEIVFGAATGTEEAPEVYARRSDLNVTFTVSASVFDRFVELTVPAPN